MARTTVKELEAKLIEINRVVARDQKRIEDLELSLRISCEAMMDAARHVKKLQEQADDTTRRFDGVRKWARKINIRVMRK